MKFEKWQALGNDYLILEATAIPFELTPPRIRAICASHTGIGADGILLLSEPESAAHAARLRIFNPDGSEAELSGNGAREARLSEPGPSEANVPAAPPNCTCSTRGRSSASRVACRSNIDNHTAAL